MIWTCHVCHSTRLDVVHRDDAEACVTCEYCGNDGPMVAAHTREDRIRLALEAYDRWWIEQQSKGVA